MFSKKAEKLIQKNISKMFKDIKQFNVDHKKISDEIDSFDKQMKERSSKRKIIRNK